MEGLKVRCQTCRQVLYETTSSYNCHRPLTGDMLRLLPLYKDWPTYDGALATESTPRFLMFCSNCAGYISITGRLMFADFTDEKVTVISKERSEMPWWNSLNDLIIGKPDSAILESVDIGRGGLERKAILGSVDNLIIHNAEDSALSDDLMTPEDLMKELDKQSRSK